MNEGLSMKYRRFNRSAHEVSEIGLGAWQLGSADWGAVNDEQAQAILDAAADAGVTFIDTADVYGTGLSEQRIGRFLASRSDRDRFFIATKLGRYPEPGGAANWTYDVMRRHTESSLQRLGISRLQLTQTHCIDAEVMRRGDVFEALRRFKQEGLIEGFGASVETVQEGLECLRVEELSSLQVIFNTFRQKPAEELFEQAQERGVAIIVRLPLASGLLSGKFTSASRFAPTDHRSYNRDGQAFNVGETFAGIEFERALTLVDWLRRELPVGLAMATAALRFCLDFPAVTTVIPGASRVEHVHQNVLASSAPPLPEALHARLREFYRSEVAGAIRGRY